MTFKLVKIINSKELMKNTILLMIDFEEHFMQGVVDSTCCSNVYERIFFFRLMESLRYSLIIDEVRISVDHEPYSY